MNFIIYKNNCSITRTRNRRFLRLHNVERQFLQAKKFQRYSPEIPVRHLDVVVAVLMAANTAANMVNRRATQMQATVPNQNPYIRNSGSYLNRCTTENDNNSILRLPVSTSHSMDIPLIDHIFHTTSNQFLIST